MKKLQKKIFLYAIFFLISINKIVDAAGSDNNYLLLRYFYPSKEKLSYKNSYLSCHLNYSPVSGITFNSLIAKGQGENGYYPEGFFMESQNGLWEQGSYYIYLEEKFGIKKIIFGNYSPVFGQGLLYGSSFPLILSNPYYDLARNRDGIYPKSTTSKNILLEGIAFEYLKWDIYFRGFLSWNTFDCSAGESDYYKYNDNDYDGIPNDEDEDDFTGAEESFPEIYSCKNDLFSCIRDESDYGTLSDREKRNNLREYILGLNLSKKWENLHAGSVLSYSFYNRLVDPYYNFEPEKGDKTGYYFRGKNLFSSSFYFKLYSPVEIFGELCATFYRRLSYYTEFNGDHVFSMGGAGGIRKKIGRVGLLFWGAYIPANLVNPHSLEYPEGCNNFTEVIFSINWLKGLRKFNTWFNFYKELYNKDLPGEEEAGISFNYSFDYPLSLRSIYSFDQEIELVDNHYYAPGERVAKLATKTSLRYKLSEAWKIGAGLETRLGTPFGESLNKGIGIFSEAFYRKSNLDLMLYILYFNTDEDRFGYIYPFRHNLYNWYYIPESVHGNGLKGAIRLVKKYNKAFTLGSKIEGIFDFFKSSRREIVIYLFSEYTF